MADYPSKARRATRHDVSLLVTHESVLSLRQDEVLNLSRDGLFLKTDNPLPGGTIIYMDLQIDKAEAPLKIVGEVSWYRAPGGAEPAGMGISFIKISQDDAARLAAFLAKN